MVVGTITLFGLKSLNTLNVADIIIISRYSLIICMYLLVLFLAISNQVLLVNLL